MTIYEIISLAINLANLILEILSYLRKSRSNKEKKNSRQVLNPLHYWRLSKNVEAEHLLTSASFINIYLLVDFCKA